MIQTLLADGFLVGNPGIDNLAGTASDTGQPYTIYFAGGLFNHKELLGNATLARFIEKVSGGRYRCILPQDLEQTAHRAAEVRNQDLLQVMKCDMAIFNFDGTELDSGTVVEMVFAKLLDIPAVVLRTDFRAGGDGFKDGDPWNLMCTAYPRNKVVLIHGMAWYQEALRAGGTSKQIEKRFYTRIATQVIEDLDAVRFEKSWFTEDVNLHEVYRAALRFPGAGMEKIPNSFVRAVIRHKMAKGLLPMTNNGFIPHKAQRLYATYVQLQQLARELAPVEQSVERSVISGTVQATLILSQVTMEKCGFLVNAVLELDRFFGDSLELYSQIYENEDARKRGAEKLAAVAITIRQQATTLQHQAEELYRQVSLNALCDYKHGQVVAQESLLRMLTAEVQKVTDLIALRAEETVQALP